MLRRLTLNLAHTRREAQGVARVTFLSVSLQVKLGIFPMRACFGKVGRMASGSESMRAHKLTIH